jgi:hypothetical protein
MSPLNFSIRSKMAKVTFDTKKKVNHSKKQFVTTHPLGLSVKSNLHFSDSTNWIVMKIYFRILSYRCTRMIQWIAKQKKNSTREFSCFLFPSSAFSKSYSTEFLWEIFIVTVDYVWNMYNGGSLSEHKKYALKMSHLFFVFARATPLFHDIFR